MSGTRSPVSTSVSADGARVSIRLYHPKGNIITADMIAALDAAFDNLPSSGHVKLITIEGEGNDFSFGASVPEHRPGEIDRVLPAMHRLVGRMLDLPAVTAAVVRGRCLGGGFELALACDVIFAADDATFGLPEIALGVFPPLGSVLLPLRAGAARATRTVLTGESASAADWAQAGLVLPAGSADGVAEHVGAWYDRHVAPRSAVALHHAAWAVRSGIRAQLTALLPGIERLYLKDLMATEDACEGIAAFLEKRPPRWKDR